MREWLLCVQLTDLRRQSERLEVSSGERAKSYKKAAREVLESALQSPANEFRSSLQAYAVFAVNLHELGASKVNSCNMQLLRL